MKKGNVATEKTPAEQPIFERLIAAESIDVYKMTGVELNVFTRNMSAIVNAHKEQGKTA